MQNMGYLKQGVYAAHEPYAVLKPYVAYGLHYSEEVTCSIWSHVQHGGCM